MIVAVIVTSFNYVMPFMAGARMARLALRHGARRSLRGSLDLRHDRQSYACIYIYIYIYIYNTTTTTTTATTNNNDNNDNIITNNIVIIMMIIVVI